MKTHRFWGRISQKTTFLLLAAAVVSVIALIWMGLRLMQQDRILEIQQLEEKREAAADRIVSALEQILSNEEQKLVKPHAVDFSLLEDDYIEIFSDSDGIKAQPEKKLLYYPILLTGMEAPTLPFVEADRAEFQNNNFNQAISLLRPLSRSKDLLIRTAANLRLARILRKAGRMNEALKAYESFESPDIQSQVTVSGIPIDLVARRARCALLEEMGDLDTLKTEAQGLLQDLNGGSWQLDRSSYLYYSGQAEEWAGQGSESTNPSHALAEAVWWLWENEIKVERSGSNLKGRRCLNFFNSPVSVLWQESMDGWAAVVAGPAYQRTYWYEPLFSSPDFSSFRISLSDSEGNLIFGEKILDAASSSIRSSLTSGLPWNIYLVEADPEAGLGQFAQRRRLLMAGLGILILLVFAVSILISRSVSRELAAARLQADFVSAVSHEFRTPLTSMRQFTEMLNEDDNLPAEKRRTFYKAQARATNRLSRLVESLLDFGRMEAGARPYSLEPMDAGELVKDIVEEFKQETGSEDIIIECVVPDVDFPVNGDREALAQALWNLLDNAVKYSGENKRIHVEVEEGDPVAIRVQDQGLGIPLSERSRIFRKFVRGTNTDIQGIKGTGIGLAVVKHIVDAHGGDISVISESGQGSTFTIHLPTGG
ncbi:ATP-binding protein [Acidobacteriota bacterium]